MNGLVVESVSKRFGVVQAVDDVSFSVADDDFLALLGPSGCGKTTLLRMIAGFAQPDQGRIILDGVDVTATPPHARPVNMMFQSYALFPHMTVAGNIAFGLRQDGLRGEALNARVREALAAVEMEGFETRRPEQLSGGQQQRVALARCIAKRPKALLLDEPLAALDKNLRERTQLELIALRRRLGIPFIVVTHDQSEAMTMATRVAVMDRGKILQIDTPRALYARPNTRAVASFVGEINLFAAPAGTTGTLGVRPEAIEICNDTAASVDGYACAHGVVEAILYRGASAMVMMRLADGQLLRVLHRDDQVVGVGDTLSVRWRHSAAVVLAS